jgi:hypothetical protein
MPQAGADYHASHPVSASTFPGGIYADLLGITICSNHSSIMMICNPKKGTRIFMIEGITRIFLGITICSNHS